jgi:hypothetical protein
LFWSGYDDDFLDVQRFHAVWAENPELVDERITIHPPPGYEIAELPAPAQATSPAASYGLEVKADGGAVVARRTLQMRLGRYPTDLYGKIRGVMRAFASARQQVVVLKKR